MNDISKLEDFSYKYFDLCNNIAQLIKKSKYQLDEPEAKNFIQKFFNRFRKKKLKISDVLYNDYDELLVMYRSIVIKYNTANNKRWEFPNLLIEFIYFIKIVEKCFFYVNDDNSKVYAEYNEIDKKYRLTIFCDDYNIIYDIQESDINMPGKVSNNDNPLSFLIDKGEECAYEKSNNVIAEEANKQDEE